MVRFCKIYTGRYTRERERGRAEGRRMSEQEKNTYLIESSGLLLRKLRLRKGQ